MTSCMPQLLTSEMLPEQWKPYSTIFGCFFELILACVEQYTSEAFGFVNPCQ